eukprot:7075008-Pyramimonas_sp.AAC.2
MMRKSPTAWGTRMPIAERVYALSTRVANSFPSLYAFTMGAQLPSQTQSRPQSQTSAEGGDLATEGGELAANRGGVGARTPPPARPPCAASCSPSGGSPAAPAPQTPACYTIVTPSSHNRHALTSQVTSTTP